MIRLPTPYSDEGTWGTVLNEFLKVEHNDNGTLKSNGTLATKADNTTVVHKSGDEAIDGIKTFSSSPIVPSPTLGSQATNKTYVDTTTATKPIVRLARITSGDIVLSNSSGAWLPVTGIEISLPAIVGDWVELDVSIMSQSTGTDFFDLAVLKGSSIVRRSSTGTASGTSSDEGDTALYPTQVAFRTTGALFAFQVTAGDLDTGNIVRFALIAKGIGGAKVFASANYPMRWRAINMGAVTVL